MRDCVVCGQGLGRMPLVREASQQWNVPRACRVPRFAPGATSYVQWTTKKWSVFGVQGLGDHVARSWIPSLSEILESLVDRVTRGAPESPQRWTSKSTRKLAQLLKLRGHPISPQKVGLLLNEAGYSLQGTSKMEEGDDHPDRNAQFEFINDQVDEFQGRGSPVISVDTKNKELVGDSGNRGKEWQPLGCRVPIMVHDFPNDATGKAIPYGVYDLAQSQVLANVGIDHDTPEFAVALILRGVADDGQEGHPDATELFITADAGGSDGYRPRLWKLELQQFADKTRMTVTVSHFPPGTSKWNKIEHRLFCYITENWRGRPLIGHENGSATYWQRANSCWARSQSPTRHTGLSHWYRCDQGRDGRSAHYPRPVSW